MKNWTFVLALGAAVCIGSGAYADDQMTPLAAAGDWLAMSHSDSITDPPDVCLASSVTMPVIALRADDQGNLDIRLANTSWSLPANVTGNIEIDVNNHKYTYAIVSNTSNDVDASITQDQLTALVGDMEAASSMQIKAGSGAPTTTSLNGSKTVLTAFMTCAGIDNPSQNTGGSNPFSSSN